MSERLDRILTLITTGCLVVVTALVVRAQLFGGRSRTEPMVGAEVVKWDILQNGPTRVGAATAPIQIVAFVDFQCPFCRTYHGAIDSLRAAQPGAYAVTIRHLPLSFHAAAPEAAALAHCAGEAGSFTDLAAAMYALQDELGQMPWESVVDSAGVDDAEGLLRCMSTAPTEAALAEDAALAAGLGVRATPTVFVNGRRFNQPPPPDTLAAYLARIEDGLNPFAPDAPLWRALLGI